MNYQNFPEYDQEYEDEKIFSTNTIYCNQKDLRSVSFKLGDIVSYDKGFELFMSHLSEEFSMIDNM